MCGAIAPGSGEELFNSMAQSTQREKFEGSPPSDLVVLMTAYKNAKTKNLKRQILSLYAYRYPMSMLKNSPTIRKTIHMGNKASTLSC